MLSSQLKGHSSHISSAQFSPDGQKIATASFDATAKIWDANTGSLLTDLKGHTEQINSVRFSPNGKKIVTASGYSFNRKSDVSDGSAKIWNTTSGLLLIDLKSDIPFELAEFSPDGEKLVTISYDKKVKIWEAGSGILLADLNEPVTNIYSIQFSPDGKEIITISHDKIKVWETNTGLLRIDLLGHTASIYSVNFSDDGKNIVTASLDKTAKVWSAETGKIINTIYLGENTMTDINFFNNKMVAVNNSEISLFDLKTGEKNITMIPVDNIDYLIVDSLKHYDGTANARKLLYFTCGTEVIELDQVKDQLWVPNLAERIMKGETINAKTLDELNICGLTPEVEDASSKAGEYYFKIKPRRGGLGETVLLVNGIEAKRYKSSALKKNGEVYDLVINKEELKNFFIAAKENPVTLKAYTTDNAISSRGVKINEDKTKEAATPPNLYAVMIGVSEYKGDELDLKYAAKDATDISAAVGNAAKKLLNADGKEHVFMYNLTTTTERYQLPEKNSIKKLLEEIGKKATANDILLIFFAGHGVMTGDADKKQFYFLTADASKAAAVSAVGDVGISTAELTEWMKPQNIQAQKRILIFDACNSGQAIKDFVKMGTGDQNYIAGRSDDKAQQIKAIDKLNEKSGLFILSASASNQSAYEMGRYSQGLLTYALLKAIKQQPDILSNGKYLDVSRWFDAAKETVSEISKESGARQDPQIVSNTNFNIGIVDEDVMAKIVLPTEKPLFAASNFQNSDESADGDNLELSKLINVQLNDIAARGTDSKIIYITATNSPDAFTLSGRYDVKNNEVSIRVSIKKNNETKYRFEEKGPKSNLKELAEAVVAKAADWAGSNK